MLPVPIDADVCEPALLQAARDDADRALALGEAHGYRNAQVTLIAPTGTIGLVMDCDTTGIEPDFALVKFKKLAGGGYFKMVNASVPPALQHLGYTPRAGRRHRPLLRRLRHARGLPAPGARQAAPARVHRRRHRGGRRRARRGVRRAVRVHALHGHRRGLHRAPRHRPRRAAQAGLRPAHGDRLHRGRDRRGERLRLRHDDGRGRAAPARRAPAGVRLRQPLRPARHACHRSRSRTSR